MFGSDYILVPSGLPGRLGVTRQDEDAAENATHVQPHIGDSTKMRCRAPVGSGLSTSEAA